MAQNYPSIPESSRYPQPLHSFVNPEGVLQEFGPESEQVESEKAAHSQPLHVYAEGASGRETTHRRVLTRSKLPVDVGQHTYVGGATEYGGETFGPPGSTTPHGLRNKLGSTFAHVRASLQTAGKAVGTARLGLLLLSRPYVAVPAILIAGGALYFGRRKREK